MIKFIYQIIKPFLDAGKRMSEVEKVHRIIEENKDHLLQLHPKFRAMVTELLLDAEAEGYVVGIHKAYRSVEAQDKLYAQGRTTKGDIVTKAKGGLSWHNYGLAVDIVFKVKGKWSWDEKLPWVQLGALGKTCGLTWGGDWPQADRPHFQYTKGLSSIREALRLYRQGGQKAVWEKIK